MLHATFTCPFGALLLVGDERRLGAIQLPGRHRPTARSIVPVWERVAEIPYDATASYVQIARDVGHPDSARAVGASSARNPCRSWCPATASSAAAAI